MRIKELTIGFVGLVFGGVIVWLASIKTVAPNSPVKIVGGSVKFKANGAWGTPGTCSNLPCLVNKSPIDGTVVTLEGNTGLTGLYSWQILVNVFNQDASASQLGATVYPSTNSGSCTPDGTTGLCITSGSTYVTSQAAASTTSFVADAPYDKQQSKPYRRYRYRDTTCCSGATEDYRESIYEIKIFYKTSQSGPVQTQTTCTNSDNADNGECKAYIGK